MWTENEILNRRMRRDIDWYSVQLMQLDLTSHKRYRHRMQNSAQRALDDLAAGLITPEELGVLETLLQQVREEIIVTSEEEVTKKIEDLVNEHHLEDIYNRLGTEGVLFTEPERRYFPNGRSRQGRRSHNHRRRDPRRNQQEPPQHQDQE